MKPSNSPGRKPKILETGYIRMKIGNQLTPEIRYTMQILDENHLDEMMELQELILSRLSREDMLLPFSVDFMRSHFSEKGFVLGILVDNEVVAFRNVYYPEENNPEWNLGRDLGLSVQACRQTANLQMVCVHPLYRGNGLALKMNRRAIDLVREQNRFAHLLATVSPYNYWNVNILLHSGFCIRTLKNKYNGKLRYIVHQNLSGVPFRMPQQSERTVRLIDFEAQKELFREGYYAFRIVESAGAHTPISQISDPYHIRRIPERFELHFSNQPLPGTEEE